MPITFQTRAHHLVYEKIGCYLAEIGYPFDVLDGVTAYRLTQGSAVGVVAVRPLNDSEALINIYCNVVEGAKVDDELLRFLLKKNCEVDMGGFGLTDGGTIFFLHSLQGTTCSRLALQQSMSVVMATSDKLDDEICERWGGKRAVTPPQIDATGKLMDDPKTRVIHPPTGSGIGDGKAVFLLYGFRVNSLQDQEMLAMELPHIADDIEVLTKAGYCVVLDPQATKSDFLDAIAGKGEGAVGLTPAALYWSGHGSADGSLQTCDSGEIRAEDLDPAQVSAGLRLVVFSSCYVGSRARAWRKAFGGQALVVGWGRPVTMERAIDFLEPDDATDTDFDDLIRRYLLADTPIPPEDDGTTLAEAVTLSGRMDGIADRVAQVAAHLRATVTQEAGHAVFQVPLEDDRSQRARVCVVDSVGPFSEGEQLFAVESEVGQMSGVASAMQLLTAPQRAGFARLAAVRSEDGSPLVVIQGFLPLTRARDQDMAALIFQVCERADRLEQSVFGSDHGLARNTTMALEFKHVGHQFGYERVLRHLKALELPYQVGLNEPFFLLQQDSALLRIKVIPYGERDALVWFLSWVVRGARLDTELLTHLLKRNNQLSVGAFGVDDDGDICLTHSLLGSTLEQGELSTTIMTLLLEADAADDAIRAEHGGVRALEPPDEPVETHEQAPPADWLPSMHLPPAAPVTEESTAAIEALRKAAEAGEAAAEAQLGAILAAGAGVAPGWVQAVAWFQKAAEHGDARSQHRLAICHHFGSGVAPEPEAALRWYRAAAEQGDAEAQSALGYLYAYGDMVDEDQTQARSWLEKAAAQGLGSALSELGFMHEIGRGVAQDADRAVACYRQGAEGGDPACMLRLSGAYQEGTGVEPDEAESLAWLTKSAEAGHAPAQLELGNRLRSGTGAEVDLAAAVSWYRAAAEQGDAGAQEALGDRYNYGEGVTQDSEEAVRWHRLAAEQGLDTAQYSLAVAYEFGQGVEQNEAEAVAWYRKGAEQDYSLCQYSLGQLYASGRGIEENQVEAFGWYQKAAAQGLADSQTALGLCYLNAAGVQRNRKLAEQSFREAAEQDDPAGQRMLGVCYAQGIGLKRSDTKAAEWLKKAADQGDNHARRELGLCLLDGAGVPADPAEAIALFQAAAADGDLLSDGLLCLCSSQGIGLPQDLASAAGHLFQLGTERGFLLSRHIEEAGFSSPRLDARWSQAVAFYRDLARQNDAHGQFLLACCLQDGNGVAIDLPQALPFMRQAAEQGFAPAQAYLGVTLVQETAPEAEQKEGVAWVEKAAEQGLHVAMEMLATYLDGGLGVPQDKARALVWRKKAAEAGNTDAQEWLAAQQEPAPAA
jgi:hypothetical protein